MHHSLVCPACGKAQFFEFGDAEKVCQYEGCVGNVIKIVYNEALLRQVISDLQAEVKRLQPAPRRTGRKPPEIQRVNGGWVVVPQIT
jgi:hypothetical protein